MAQFQITSEKRMSVIVLNVTIMGSLRKAVHQSGREFKKLRKKLEKKMEGIRKTSTYCKIKEHC